MALGKLVAEIDEQMPYRELLAWQAFARLEPFGDTRADYRMGVLASTLLLPHLKKGAKGPEPLDFMHFIERPTKKKGQRVTPANLKAALPKSPPKKKPARNKP